MELSQFSDFALRTLIYAGLKDGQRFSAADVAETYQLSQNHLVKVVQRLASLGYLKTSRGRGGGIELGRDPKEICIGAVLRQTEKFGLAACLRDSAETCCIEPACKLKGALVKAQTAFLGVLDDYTLEDLLKPRSQLTKLLVQE